MSLKRKKYTRKTGLPPGSLIYTGERKSEKVIIELIDYSESSYEVKSIENIEDCAVYKDKPSVTWINIEGIHDTSIIEKTGKIFGIHPLLLEDILNTNQRPKAEDFEDYLFFTLKMLHFDEAKKEIGFEQVSFILGQNYIISFQEGIAGDLFDSIRERLKNNKGTTRKKGADYLVYLLIDAVVDNYYQTIERLDATIEQIEEAVMTDKADHCVASIQKIKKDLIYLRKSIYPLREAISYILKGESKLIDHNTLKYFRDVYDHTIYIFENIETYRDILTGLLDVHLSSLSNRMNVVMKMLTIISTIFIPLTFIVGVYGMNFKFMPELDWPYSYPIIWGVMILISIIMVIYFRRKKWF